MKNFIFLITLLLFGAEPVFGQMRSLKVADKNTKEPVIRAHILDPAGMVVTFTDMDGKFTINTEDYPDIIITAVGYTSKEIHLQPELEIVYLNPVIFRNKTEVIIVGNQNDEQNIHAYHNEHSSHSMDDFLENIDGISITKRGAFGWEPAVRGQSDQRMNLVIDGMQVFKACVDKMDPITSYVETNNLSSLQIDKSGSGVAENGTGNSTVNLVTQKAESSPFSMELNSAYRAPDQYRSFGLSGSGADKSGKNAFRFTGNYKKADDFRAGNDQTIGNTQYEKLNLNVSYRHVFASQHSVEVNYITDKAYDIGYPALLMDATKALADIGQIQFNFAKSDKSFQIESAKLYANTIRHWMDDYSRDVANRPVMRGMYMPMYGNTETFGLKLNGQAAFFDHNFEWFIDAFTSEAFGDMLMESLDPDIADMLIYNLDEVRTNNGGIGFRHRFTISESVLLKLEENLRFKTLGTSSRSHASFFEGLYDRELKTRFKFLISASGSVLWMINDAWSLSGSLVYSERMGNHMELFGHYIYNYTDGYFYDGDPWLKTERTVNADLNATWETKNNSLSFSLFHKQYFNYIDGILSEDVSNNDFKFKRYANVGDAVILGGELRNINSIGNYFRLENRLSYLYAHNQTLDEPLPLIPPFKGISMLNFTKGMNTIIADMEWAAKQNRIAGISSIEDKTDSYAIFNLTYERSLLNSALITSVEVNNLTDEYYHTHTSIGNIPEAGRSFMVSVKYRY
ncbi:MAG: TonB-dependent receptor [Gracilimonas sp.]